MGNPRRLFSLCLLSGSSDFKCAGIGSFRREFDFRRCTGHLGLILSGTDGIGGSQARVSILVRDCADGQADFCPVIHSFAVKLDFCLVRAVVIREIYIVDRCSGLIDNRVGVLFCF